MIGCLQIRVSPQALALWSNPSPAPSCSTYSSLSVITRTFMVFVVENNPYLQRMCSRAGWTGNSVIRFDPSIVALSVSDASL